MTNPFRTAARLRVAPLAALTMMLALGSLLVAPGTADAQALTGTIVVRVTADTLPVPGAAVAAGGVRSATDQSGRATLVLPTGRHTLEVAPDGFRPESFTVFVGVGTKSVTVPMRRSSAPPPQSLTAPEPHRPRASQPTHTIVSSREALDEQLERSPGTIVDLLDRMDGVRVQSLSAGSGGAGIRIRGMPARYTKLLTDGLPLSGATPEGQDVVQMSALGLDRVEVIPGVTAALNGPTAFGGTVNAISAGPTSPSQVIVNGNTHLGADVALWQTRTFSPRWAATLLAGRHSQEVGDTDGDGWAEVNGYKRLVVRPRVYWARTPQSSWFMTGGWTGEYRRSGTFGDARLPDFNRYSDDVESRRADVGTVGRIEIDTSTVVTIRASMTREWRMRWYGNTDERERRNEVFGDVSIRKSIYGHALTGGVAIDRDQFAALDARRHSYRYTTPALYAEHSWMPDSWFGITSSARLDLHSEYGDFVSPRVSVVVRPSNEWQVRLARSAGVYAPTPFTDETEGFGLSRIDWRVREAERALGWSLDVAGTRGALELRGSAYRTVIEHALAFRIPPGSAEGMQLMNAEGPSRTQGADVSAGYRAGSFRYTASYSYLDAMRPQIGVIAGMDFTFDTTMHRATPYTPRHSVDVGATHERANDRLVGLEVRFVGQQVLADSSLGESRPYVTADARIEKHVRRAIVFVRGKNLTGVRQSQFAPVLRSASGAALQWADNVWAPLDGLVVSAGLRVKY